METLKRLLMGVDYRIVYDPTIFVRGSIEAVVKPCWKRSCWWSSLWSCSCRPGGPLLFRSAVPVSLVGVRHHARFRVLLNALSLFGLVLAIGIVVDDAIVVVENVERNIHLGRSPVKPPARPCRDRRL